MSTKVLIKIFLLLFFTLSFLLFSTELAFPQNLNKKSNQKTAETLSIKLKQKVLLTDEQTKKVESILLEYLNSNEKGEKNLTETQNKIEELLDVKQRVKYRIIKASWWEEIMKAASNP